jgi:hypothetical protein
MLTLDGDEWSDTYNNLFHFWCPLKRGYVGPRTHMKALENRNVSGLG